MARARFRLRSLLAALVCALGASSLGSCGEASSYQRADAGSLFFTIGGTPFYASSGTVQASAGALTFWLTDQADSCCAVLYTPQQPLTALRLQVQPPTDGTTTVAIVAKAAPAAGEAVGGLTLSRRGEQQASHAAADGKLTWTLGTNGYFTITRLDLGFADTTDRLTLPSQVTLPPCTGCTPP